MFHSVLEGARKEVRQLEALNDRLDFSLDQEIIGEPEVLTLVVITDEVELTEIMACAKCGGECKIF